MTLATAALLLSVFAIATARAEETVVPKRSAYPSIEPKPGKPAMTADERLKLQKELTAARDRQAAKGKGKAKDDAKRPETVKP